MFDSEELDELEKSLRQLQIGWEKYFGGLEKRAPTTLQARVERVIRNWLRGEVRNNTLRYRSQMLTARFNTLNQLWQKRLRALEEGRPLGVHRGVPRVPSPAEAAETPRRAARAAGDAVQPVRVANVARDRAAVRDLFDRFVEARRQAGENAAVRFENFEKLISKQADRILTQKGAQAVDFRLETSGGKVSLKARPVK